MRAGTADVKASRADGLFCIRNLLATAAFVMAMASNATHAANEVYTYDNAGRLIIVDHGDGRTTTYTLDPAGNRTALQTTETAAPPATLTVPTGSTTGSYNV